MFIISENYRKGSRTLADVSTLSTRAPVGLALLFGIVSRLRSAASCRNKATSLCYIAIKVLRFRGGAFSSGVGVLSLRVVGSSIVTYSKNRRLRYNVRRGIMQFERRSKRVILK